MNQTIHDQSHRIYLDHAATTPVHPKVVKAMLPFFTERFGNASTQYSFGQEAKGAMEDVRSKIVAFIAAKSSREIIFTGGGTESDNFAICGIAWANQNKSNHIITSSVEHHAVLNTCKFMEKRGIKVTYLPVDEYGLVDPEDVKKAITDKTILISIMQANNEVGTIGPIAEIGKITREKGIYFHTDAVQSFGHIPINVDDLNVDLLSASAHKLYGPKGVGMLYVRKGTQIVPFLYGGEQEFKHRASTENVAGIVGFGKALEIAAKGMVKERKRLASLRDKLIKGLLERIEFTQLNGHPTRRLPGNVNVSIKYVEGESMLLKLDGNGICASSGSACTSRNLEPSHVLTAMGIPPDVAHSSLRFTLGRENTEDDVDYVLEVMPDIVKDLRLMSPLYREKRE
jgi:cysteine desulfurase